MFINQVLHLSDLTHLLFADDSAFVLGCHGIRIFQVGEKPPLPRYFLCKFGVIKNTFNDLIGDDIYLPVTLPEQFSRIFPDMGNDRFKHKIKINLTMIFGNFFNIRH